MKPVCLDSHIYIWGIKETARPGQEDMIPKAKGFIGYLEEQSTPIILPTTIISELLAPVDPAEYENFMKLIDKRFRVVPVDVPASIKMAEIWNRKHNSEELRQYRDEHEITRERMKFDFQIAAVAIVRGCECIYSNDPHIRKFVGDEITIREMPNIGIQTSLSL